MKHIIVFILAFSYFLMNVTAQPRLPEVSSERYLTDSGEIVLYVKERVISYLIGGEGIGFYRKNAIKVMDEWVESVLSREFEPLKWENSYSLKMNVRITNTTIEIRRLACAYKTPGSIYEKNNLVKRRIILGLENILEYFNPESHLPGNWYQWLISIPDNLGAITLLMEHDLPTELKEQVLTSIREQISDRLILTGTNAAWEARNHIYLALLDKDANRLERAAKYVFNSVRFSTKQGIREDYCYLFHGQLPYAGNYGAGLVQTIAEFIYVFDGTPYAISQSYHDLITNMILEHSRWFLIDDYIDLHITGRSFKRKSNSIHILEALLVLAQTNTPGKKELAKTASYILQKSKSINLDLTCAGFADEIKDEQGELPYGFRYWASGEIGAYKQPSYHIGFRQYSNRVQDYEYLNREDGGEGEEGWNLPFGFTNIIREDGKGCWYSDTTGFMIPEIDVEHLSGITSRIGGNPVNPKFKKTDDTSTKSTTGFSLNFGKSPFAGAAGWKNNGVAGFILIPPYGEFIAKKSLHFFPKGFWALGSGITSTAPIDTPTNNQVHTTVLQWSGSKENPKIIYSGGFLNFRKETERTQKNVKWFWIEDENVGVVFHTPENIVVRLSGKVITIWINHGAKPVNKNYAYAVLPNISQQELKSFAASPTIKPVRYDNNVHAVKEDTGNGGIVFFEPDSCLGIKSFCPSVIYRDLDDLGSIYSIQDPLHEEKTMKIITDDISGSVSYTNEAVKIEPKGKYFSSIEINTYQGRLYRFGLGEYGKQVSQQPRIELEKSSYEDFKVKVVSDQDKTILTVHLPDEAVRDGYKLSVHYIKSQRLHDFTEADIVDRPSANVVRYRWNREDITGPRIFSDYFKIKDGHFVVHLVSKYIQSTDTFTVPKFD